MCRRCMYAQCTTSRRNTRNEGFKGLPVADRHGAAEAVDVLRLLGEAAENSWVDTDILVDWEQSPRVDSPVEDSDQENQHRLGT